MYGSPRKKSVRFSGSRSVWVWETRFRSPPKATGIKLRPSENKPATFNCLQARETAWRNDSRNGNAVATSGSASASSESLVKDERRSARWPPMLAIPLAAPPQPHPSPSPPHPPDEEETAPVEGSPRRRETPDSGMEDGGGKTAATAAGSDRRYTFVVEDLAYPTHENPETPLSLSRRVRLRSSFERVIDAYRGKDWMSYRSRLLRSTPLITGKLELLYTYIPTFKREE